MTRAIVDDIAALAYLTSPAEGQLVINMKFDEEFKRYEINRDQLAGIVVEGAKMLWGRGE